MFLCLGEEDAKHILLHCKKTKHWRLKLNMKKDVTYWKIMKITNKVHLQNLGKYSDVVKNKWLIKIKEM